MTANGAGPLDAQQKASRINSDGSRFGVFAEIGAGQEVVRWFFHVGGASKTVAKSISAYDMAASDDLYGKAQRYVSRERLEAMLDCEYGQLLDRSNAQRGSTTSFFVFADTVATRGASDTSEGRGWLGVRFQDRPGAERSEIIVHVRMFDITSTAQQEAAGLLGVNLIYGAFYHHDPRFLISTLMDGLSRRRVEIGLIKFSGPAFPDIDNRLISLQLVEQRLTDATMFTAQGEVVQPSEVLYQKPVLIERGSFRPVTNVTLRIVEHARRQLQLAPETAGQEPVEIFEMTLNNLMTGREVDHKDFLARVDVLGALNKLVMVSNFTRFDLLSSFLRRQTRSWIAMAVGIPTLQVIFDEKYYSDLEGGILEGLGLLFGKRTRLLVYPTKETPRAGIATAEGLQVAPPLRRLYSYLYDNGWIEPIRNFDPAQLNFVPGDALARIRSGDPAWEEMVPPEAAAVIRRERLFGYPAVKE
ncbi:MAG TPA: TonB-dependent receptor [Bryobacteraceae bacterium]|nr:TonB-dependent receptor [Bryobacteraceae bacterium]